MPFHISTAKKEQPLQLIQLTDSHLLEDASKNFAGVYPLDCLKSVLAHIKQHQDLNQVDAILSTGDIAQEPSEKTYQQYLDQIDTFNKPHFIIRGNHDTGPSFPCNEDGQAHDQPTIILMGNWCIILLNSQLNGCTYGQISTPHLEQLSQILEQYQSYHILIALHHHTFPVGSAWLDQHILQNSDAFLARITPYKNIKLVICGHVHQTSEHVHQGITFLSTPSTFVQFKPHSQDFMLDDRPPGYRMIKLYGNGDFESEVHHLTESVGNIDHSLREY